MSSAIGYAEFGCGKLGNDYARQLGKLYNEIPKSVLAAIAVSALTCGGDQLETALERVAEEWDILHQNGIVKQKPSKTARAALPKARGESHV
jgi:hypothetical protein